MCVCVHVCPSVRVGVSTSRQCASLCLPACSVNYSQVVIEYLEVVCMVIAVLNHCSQA